MSNTISIAASGAKSGQILAGSGGKRIYKVDSYIDSNTNTWKVRVTDEYLDVVYDGLATGTINIEAEKWEIGWP